MKIQSIPTPPTYNNKTQKTPVDKAKKPVETEAAPVRQEKVPTYNKSGKLDQVSIQSLQEESDKAFASLKRIVMELLKRQGKPVADIEKAEQVEVDDVARTEAAALIADDGPLGAEAVSNRIVDFAIAISGGDKSKLELLKGAIEEGFQQAENVLGELPEVSIRTYDLVMEKLSAWGEE